ncbi:putative WEB family protein At1g65010, chloroplastic [Impatiens glandulifera]|uniref:putative WEB family protein At1g65010, chloroplastic n=1 Tax=Impatiens glandulifera TaxID=253017 RepID=UPI001FB0C28C|nr:putative WEB family protein At1g65010, chloroplastic [Impatiens glandulifera]
MEDETIINGGSRTVDISGNDDREEDFVDFNVGNGTESSGLVQKIEVLEQEKQNLSEENELMRHKIEKLKAEAEALETEKVELKRRVDMSEAEKKKLQLISIRVAELDKEVSGLQQDLVSSMAVGEETNKELIQLKKAFEEMKKIESEKNCKFGDLEKERNLLVERIHNDDEGVREAKEHGEARVKEMEKKIESLEHREDSVKSDRFTIEQETKAKMVEKDAELLRLKTQIEDLGSAGVRSDSELERLKNENAELEIVKNELEAHVKKSERQAKEMEQMVDKLNKELEASESIVNGLKEKENEVHDDVDGKVVIVSKDDPEVGLNGLSGMKLQWPVVAATTGVAVAAVAAFCYLRYVKQS